MVPKLMKGFSLRGYLDKENSVNTEAIKGGPHHIIFPINKGFLKTEGLDAEILPGSGDWLLLDPVKNVAHLDVRIQCRTTKGHTIHTHYHGLLKLDEKANKVLQWQPDAKTTEFGDHYWFSQPIIETSDPDWKWIENETWLGEGRVDYNDTITVLVGPQENRLILHENVITSCSRFFKAACAKGFKETHEKLVRLPEVQEEVFKLYVHWIYTSNIDIPISNDQETKTQKNDASGERYYQFAQLYILADVLGDLHLRNETMTRFLVLADEVSRCPDSHTINLAYKETPDRSPLRNLLKNMYLAGSNTKWFGANGQSLPKDFLFDLALGGMEIREKRLPVPKMTDKCCYHEHNDEVPKCSQL